ncbi:PsiF family protein [Roseateles sp. BYS96W]|uniref:PsiF family protein n=1 Tax=Pelomonas nitida TaxID=3299027 RepID=A0ABW7G5Q5_9BURK
MKHLSIAIALGVAALTAQAADKTADKAPSAQQSKMSSCNKDAADKKGDERKAFMKECLSAKGGDAASAAPAAAPAASPACEKSAADKKLHGAAAKSHIKKCMADAASAPK